MENNAVNQATSAAINGGGIKEIAIGFGAGIGAAIATKLIAIGVKKAVTVVKAKVAEKKNAVKPVEPSTEGNAAA